MDRCKWKGSEIIQMSVMLSSKVPLIIDTTSLSIDKIMTKQCEWKAKEYSELTQ